ncbi:hypothetical protein XENOCAPTIV_012151, partial [Xenoophorus captivus]
RGHSTSHAGALFMSRCYHLTIIARRSNHHTDRGDITETERFAVHRGNCVGLNNAHGVTATVCCATDHASQEEQLLISTQCFHVEAKCYLYLADPLPQGQNVHLQPNNRTQNLLTEPMIRV